MNYSLDEQMTRRDALRRLAFTPIKLYGLSAVSTTLTYSIEEILGRCAAGITACEYLSNSNDLTVAFSAISAYLPILNALIKTSSLHRQAIAKLVTQCLFLKQFLGCI